MCHLYCLQKETVISVLFHLPLNLKFKIFYVRMLLETNLNYNEYPISILEVIFGNYIIPLYFTSLTTTQLKALQSDLKTLIASANAYYTDINNCFSK